MRHRRTINSGRLSAPSANPEPYPGRIQRTGEHHHPIGLITGLSSQATAAGYGIATAVVLAALLVAKVTLASLVTMLLVYGIFMARAIQYSPTVPTRAALRLYADARTRLRGLDGVTHDGYDIRSGWVLGPWCVLAIHLEEGRTVRVFISRYQQPPDEWRRLRAWWSMWRFNRGDEEL